MERERIIGLIKACMVATWVFGLFELFPFIEFAEAAGGAFAVDTADVNEADSCKVESWLSAADNADRAAVVNPACVLNVFREIEFSAQISRTRSGGDWTTSVAPKAKTNFVPTAIGSFGFAGAFGASVDALTGENTSIFAYVPATYRFSDNVRVNLNGGWNWDRTVDRHYFTYGAAIDVRLSEVITWTGEVFGQAGVADDPYVIRPRFQTGLRYRPIETFSLDVIYGRNITGENANWITVGTTIRFPPK
jgi:hypothetical protein